MFSHKRRLFLLILLMVLLVACNDDREPARAVIDRPAQVVTDQAATAFALTNAPPTAGPSPTPSPTPTPYGTATPLPGYDPDLVLATVGGRDITVAYYQARVRYERWLPLEGLKRLLDKEGPSRLLDLTLSENSRTLSLFYTLSDPDSIGVQSMDAILTDQIILREAANRDLEIEQTVFDGRMAARIGTTLGEGGKRPDDWDETYQAFLERLELYTGMSEEQFLETVRALVYYEQLRVIIGDQAELPETTVTSVTVQDAFFDSRADALDVIERLQAGEALVDIARDYGKSPSNGETQREIQRDTEGLNEELINAVFEATPGMVIGPFPSSAGWYVANILDRKLDIPNPGDLQAVKDEYFRQWILAKMDDPEYTTLLEKENGLELYRDFIPLDPLPQDVSPMMRDEFVKLPENAYEEDDPTPTAIPLGNSPR
ncbi:MAG: hypothetical protein BroJett018_01210 [Chloroflexota bacterium]|nr:hypothetical protein [Chloroflexota bacterium]NOG63468.1 hypothetical protein [Chloroflexota bacterium]GIK62327.1 MAG: hypothetical protein BroJett018_01210 [Chloroflexota bacterium]